MGEYCLTNVMYVLYLFFYPQSITTLRYHNGVNYLSLCLHDVLHRKGLCSGVNHSYVHMSFMGYKVYTPRVMRTSTVYSKYLS